MKYFLLFLLIGAGAGGYYYYDQTMSSENVLITEKEREIAVTREERMNVLSDKKKEVELMREEIARLEKEHKAKLRKYTSEFYTQKDKEKAEEIEKARDRQKEQMESKTLTTAQKSILMQKRQELMSGRGDKLYPEIDELNKSKQRVLYAKRDLIDEIERKIKVEEKRKVEEIEKDTAYLKGQKRIAESSYGSKKSYEQERKAIAEKHARHDVDFKRTMWALKEERERKTAAYDKELKEVEGKLLLARQARAKDIKAIDKSLEKLEDPMLQGINLPQRINKNILNVRDDPRYMEMEEENASIIGDKRKEMVAARSDYNSLMGNDRSLTKTEEEQLLTLRSALEARLEKILLIISAVCFFLFLVTCASFFMGRREY